MRKYEFKGWWGDGDEKDCKRPWETFKVVLSGVEAGDQVETAKGIDRVLDLAGYELVLKRKKGK